MPEISRRQFIGTSLPLAAAALSSGRARGEAASKPLFDISLAEWSLHRALFGKTIERLDWPELAAAVMSDPAGALAGTIKNLDFPVIARREFDIGAVEYVNQFFFDKARDEGYLRELKLRADGEGVRNVLIMVDLEGPLASPKMIERHKAVEAHRRWISAAAQLGCHAIRVNAHGEGPPDDQRQAMAESLRRLGEYGDAMGISVLVENHGGLSSDCRWLMRVIAETDHPRVGTLPDFGNFPHVKDAYGCVARMMANARAVSAKSHAFDAQGNETEIDYRRMLKIVVDAGYGGFVGIEYEGGPASSEHEGIRATKRLLERVRAELAAGRA